MMHSLFQFLIATILINLVGTTVASSVGTVFDLPSLNSNDNVDIYLLESSFPYNAPQSAK